MIIYTGTIKQFNQDVFNGVIANKLEQLFIEHHIPKESQGEYRSWHNSLEVVSNVLLNSSLNANLNVAVEYQIPLTSKRVDFLLSGLDHDGKETVIAVELKQWDKVEKTSLENCVKTVVNGVNGVHPHPSQQILSYCQIISNYNVSVQEDNINLVPCAFLHNYPSEKKDILEDECYEYIINKAPCFYKSDKAALANFLSKHILTPADRDLYEVIDNGKLKPSKALQDSILDLLEGKDEFTMVDEQQVAYSTVMHIVKQKLNTSNKYTVIVRGGPGTGKSVVAIQLLTHLTALGYATSYMTKNSAPRNVFSIKLTEGHKTKKFIGGILKSPISLEHNTQSNIYPCIICDESHRFVKHYGHNQIEDIIRASQVNVFFIDEDQRVTVKDIGTVNEIKRIAALYGSRVVDDESLTLKSQFRCNGSDGYLAFLDNLLGIRETANTSLDGIDYDVVVYDDPNEMRNDLRKINAINNKARMLAGYCYEWLSQYSPKTNDIYLDNGFTAQWNFNSTTPWAIDPESFEQVGCIHTSQGLEFDYVGVIIGKDLQYKDGHVITDRNQIAESDKSSGIRTTKDLALADRLIRNTYKTLLSRGQKGCFIYCEDKNLANYIKGILNQKAHKEDC